MATEETNPLVQKEFGRIGDWETWKKLWGEARHAEQLTGLLHAAFDLESYGGAWGERLRFLLRVADGHDAPPIFRDQLRRLAAKLVAQKAFKVLCRKYFSLHDGHNGVSAIRGMSPGMLEDVLWFFCDRDRRSHGRNLPRVDGNHHDKVARDYVRALIRESWTIDRSQVGERRDVDEATEEAFKAARPKYVVLLRDLGELDFLYEERGREVDEASLEALRRLALFDGDGKQVHRDAEEAVDTDAGRALLILEAKANNEERRRRLAEAERKKRDAEREIEEARGG